MFIARPGCEKDLVEVMEVWERTWEVTGRRYVDLDGMEACEYCVFELKTPCLPQLYTVDVPSQKAKLQLKLRM